MKILPVIAELFHADGQTDMTKLIVAFRSFANAPKMAGVSIFKWFLVVRGPGSSVGIVTDCGLDGPGIESRWG
jgi:hypothetical protein